MSKHEVLIGPHNGSNANWFQLTSFSSTNHTTYDYRSFCQLIEKQMLSHLQYDLLTNQIKVNNCLSVQDFRISLNEQQFREIIRHQPSDTELFPLITFHSTQNVTKVNSILTHGYIVAGEQHPSLGYTVRMQNGNIYGDGIYSTNRFCAMQWYSFVDDRSSIQVIMNLLFVKRYKVVRAEQPYEEIPSLDAGKAIYYEYEKPKSPAFKRKGSTNSPEIPIYREYDTLMSSEGNIFITANPKNIYPLGIATLGIVNQGTENQNYLTTSANLPMFMRHFSRSKGVIFGGAVDPKITIPCYRFFGEYHFIDASVLSKNLKYNSKDLLIKHVFLIPPSIVSNHATVNTINQFINSVATDSTTVQRSSGLLKTYEIIKVGSFYSSQFQNFQAVDSLIGHIFQQAKGFQKDENVATAVDSLCNYLTNDQNRNKMKEEKIQIVYFFVAHPTHLEQLSGVYEKWNKYLSVQLIQIKVIFLFDYHQEILKLKFVAHSLYSFESHYYYQARLISTAVGKGKRQRRNQEEASVPSSEEFRSIALPLEDIFNYLLDEIAVMHELFDTMNLSYAVPYPLGIIGEGFIPSFHQQPCWDYQHNSYEGVLYKGYLSHIKINSNYYELTHDLIETHVDRLEAVARIFLTLLSKFRLFIFQFQSRCHYFLPKILPFYRALMNSLSTSRSFQAIAITTIKQLKYQLMVLISDICAIGRIDFSEKWFQLLKSMKFMKKIQHRFTYTFDISSSSNSSLRYLVKRTYDFKVKEPADLLQVLPKDLYRGIMIRVERSEASNIEPWLLIIDYLSADSSDAASIYVLNELSSQLEEGSAEGVLERMLDQKREPITDVLLLPQMHPRGEDSIEDESFLMTDADDALKLYYGYLFTRVPYCYHHSQLIALPTIAFVSLIHQAYMKTLWKAFRGVDYDVKECNQLFHKAFALIPTIQSLLTRYYQQSSLLFLQNIVQEENFEKYLLEANEIPSICKIVGILLLPQTRDLIHHHSDIICDAAKGDESFQPNFQSKWNRFCFALLAEAIMRSCKSYLRSTKQLSNVDEVIRETLQINEQSDPDNYHLNVADAIQSTNRIMLNTHYSNCSPYAVMSCIQFIEFYHELQVTSDNQRNVEDIFDKFHQGDCLPKFFLQKHFPAAKNGKIIQLALFLLAMKYCSSKLRETNSEQIIFHHPKQIVDQIIEEQLKYVRYRQQLQQSLSNRVGRRLLVRVNRAIPYQNYHKGLPKLFTTQEVDDLNRSRPKDDQLRVMNSGLLFHHCCYENCPQYLQNLSTENDRISMRKYANLPHRWKNNGLNHHLENNRLLHLYIPNFHSSAKLLLSHRPGATSSPAQEFDHFATEMAKLLKGSTKYYQGNLQEALQLVFLAYQR